MALRPCITCGTPSDGARCPGHRRTYAKPPHRERRPDYDAAERRRRAKAVADHRAMYGDWCPGWGVPAHASADLTADHVHGVAAGGSEHGLLTVLCRSCNGRKR